MVVAFRVYSMHYDRLVRKFVNALKEHQLVKVRKLIKRTRSLPACLPALLPPTPFPPPHQRYRHVLEDTEICGAPVTATIERLADRHGGETGACFFPRGV